MMVFSPCRKSANPINGLAADVKNVHCHPHGVDRHTLHSFPLLSAVSAPCRAFPGFSVPPLAARSSGARAANGRNGGSR
jgi:hypothetical protein